MIEHLTVARFVSRKKLVILGGILPDIIIGPVLVKDRLFGRKEAPAVVIGLHRLLHSFWFAGLIYAVNKDLGQGWLLHLSADLATHEPPERTPPLWPIPE